MFDEIKSRKNDDKLLVELFEDCYNFLMKFIKHNSDNKKHLFKYIDFFLDNLLNIDVG